MTRPTTLLHTVLVLVAVLPPATGLAAAEPVITYRNGGTGAYPEADPPLEWSATKNVAWRWDGPVLDRTVTSPIMVGDRLFTVADPVTLVCLDKRTGEVLWKREQHVAADSGVAGKLEAAARRSWRLRELHFLVKSKGRLSRARQIRDMGLLVRKGRVTEDSRPYFTGLQEQMQSLYDAARPSRAERASEFETLQREPLPWGLDPERPTAALTPVSDGQRVVAQFAPGLVVCYDLDGALLWTRALADPEGKPIANGRLSPNAVPCMVDGQVLVARGGVLTCLEVATGEVRWKRSGFRHLGTFVAGRAGDRSWFMAQDGQVGRVSDGETAFKARVGEYHFPLSVSADKRTFHYVRGAIRLPAESTAKPGQLWLLGEQYVGGHSSTLGGHHSTRGPAVAGDRLYFNEAGGGVFTAIDAETGGVVGEPVTQEGAHRWARWAYGDGDFNLAGDVLICFRRGGDALLVEAGDDFTEVGRNPSIGPMAYGNPLFEGKRMYVRTRVALFCFEEPPGR